MFNDADVTVDGFCVSELVGNCRFWIADKSADECDTDDLDNAVNRSAYQYWICGSRTFSECQLKIEWISEKHSNMAQFQNIERISMKVAKKNKYCGWTSHIYLSEMTLNIRTDGVFSFFFLAFIYSMIHAQLYLRIPEWQLWQIVHETFDCSVEMKKLKWSPNAL